jgi:hypothetical protein
LLQLKPRPSPNSAGKICRKATGNHCQRLDPIETQIMVKIGWYIFLTKLFINHRKVIEL